MAQGTLKHARTGAAVAAGTNSLVETVWWNIHDTFVITRRNLMYYLRQPQLLVFSTIQPIMFTLLFAYVFGGAIEGTAGAYINFLIPGILVQTVVFGASQTTVGLADDLSKGMIDRFRSLPMGRAAVLAGRTLADSVRSLFVVLLVLTVGAIIGFRAEGGVLGSVLAIAVVVAFGHAFTWISAWIGLLVKTPETAQVAGFVWLFPIVFASAVFVDVSTMPAWLQVFAANQPVTAVAQAARALFLGTASTPMVLGAFGWSLALWLIFMPLAVRQYGRRV